MRVGLRHLFLENALTELDSSGERWARQDRTAKRVLNNVKHSREVSVLTEI